MPTPIYGTLRRADRSHHQTAGTSASTVEGWALLITENTIAGSAVIRNSFGSQFVVGFGPLDTRRDTRFGLP